MSIHFSMITISLYVILFLYLFFLLAFAIFTLVNIGHLVSTGTFTTTSFAMTFLFVAFSITVLVLTAIQITQFDWQQQVTIWDPAWLSGTSSINQPF